MIPWAEYYRQYSVATAHNACRAGTAGDFYSFPGLLSCAADLEYSAPMSRAVSRTFTQKKSKPFGPEIRIIATQTPKQAHLCN
jgi:hypothetical protein